MLGTEMREQLRNLFHDLQAEITFTILDSSHTAQGELEEILNELVSTSEKLKIKKVSESASVPSFYLAKNGIKKGIAFRGIPNGHEFSSLILAILNIDGRGKLPDLNIQKRIQNLAGPITLKTYISLSCENCPDVIQALNQMSLYHEDFTHEMVDGALVENEVEALNIQGVPSIVSNGTLLHSGKANFLDLLTKLEVYFGTKESSENSPSSSDSLGSFDVVILGGGPAGSSAAIYAARKGLKTAMVVERFGGQVRDTKGIENFVSVLYTEGEILSAQLRDHVSKYDIKVFEHRRVLAVETENKIIRLESKESIQYQALVIATGAKWRELGVPGEKEYIGRGVAFCPHFDGPYYKGKKVAVIGGGNSGVEAAIDLSQIVKEVIVLEFADNLKADQVLIQKMLSLPNISFFTNVKTEKILGNKEKVTNIEYTERTTLEKKQLELDGIFVQIGLSPNSQFLKGVVELTKFGEILIDHKGRTSDPAIFAAGDVTTVPYKQIIISMGEGAKAALAAFEYLKLH